MKKSFCFIVFFVAVVLLGGMLATASAEAAMPVLTYPNGGEKLFKGGTYTITWEGHHDKRFAISLSVDSGGTFTYDIGSGTGGRFEWTIADEIPVTSKARITILYLEMSSSFPPQIISLGDSSDADFTILKPLDWRIIPIIMPPAAPAELTATAASSSSIRLSWQDKSTDELGFKVFRKTVSGDYNLIKTLENDTTTYLDRGLEANTQYVYKVQAFNSAGAKDSNETSATTRPPDPMPVQTVMRFYIGSSDCYINDRLVGMDVAPVILEGRTLIPVRYVADPLGAEIAWDATARKATVSLWGKVVDIWVGKNIAQVNGLAKLIDPLNPNVTAITLPPGRIVLPLRFVAENLGCEVNWTAATQEVRITYTVSSGGGGGNIL